MSSEVGRNVTAEELRDDEADLGYEGYHQESQDHTAVEREGCLYDLLHRSLSDCGADEENGTNRRCEKTDTAVENDHDTELDRIKTADACCDREQDRGCDQDDRSHVHDTAENEKDQVQEQDQDDPVACQ